LVTTKKTRQSSLALQKKKIQKNHTKKLADKNSLLQIPFCQLQMTLKLLGSS